MGRVCSDSRVREAGRTTQRPSKTDANHDPNNARTCRTARERKRRRNERSALSRGASVAHPNRFQATGNSSFDGLWFLSRKPPPAKNARRSLTEIARRDGILIMATPDQHWGYAFVSGAPYITHTSAIRSARLALALHQPVATTRLAGSSASSSTNQPRQKRRDRRHRRHRTRMAPLRTGSLTTHDVLTRSLTRQQALLTRPVFAAPSARRCGGSMSPGVDARWQCCSAVPNAGSGQNSASDVAVQKACAPRRSSATTRTPSRPGDGIRFADGSPGIGIEHSTSRPLPPRITSELGQISMAGKDTKRDWFGVENRAAHLKLPARWQEPVDERGSLSSRRRAAI